MSITRPKQILFKPGDTVPATGIYRVEHGEHRLPHMGILLQGEVFPPCRGCKAEVRFTLVRAAGHLTGDWDLAGPESLPGPGKAGT